MTDAFEIPVEVQPSDIDVLDHVNNVVYLRWVQEAAIAHWMALTTGAQRRDLAWVVSRHEIDYKRAARLGDALVARTWVGEVDHNTFERHTEILRLPDRKVVARTRTLWVPIDPASGKPQRVPEDIRRLVSAGASPSR